MTTAYRWNGHQTDARKRRQDGTSSGTPKVGGNKGVMAARRMQKRAEAEERNARTLPHRRRGHRLASGGES